MTENGMTSKVGIPTELGAKKIQKHGRDYDKRIYRIGIGNNQNLARGQIGHFIKYYGRL